MSMFYIIPDQSMEERNIAYCFFDWPSFLCTFCDDQCSSTVQNDEMFSCDMYLTSKQAVIYLNLPM